MTIPELTTSDKSFICSYVIGSNVDHRLASGVINEIVTYTTEYVEGYAWIPVCAPVETNDESWFWDAADKDIVYVKVGCRVSADGYLHTWLLDTQKVSELILWNTRYNQTYNAVDDTTTLHWTIEKLYRQVWGSTAGYNASNISFQKYISGTRLYLFGSHSNSLSNPIEFNSTSTIVQASDISWYPNNVDVTYGDFLSIGVATKSCTIAQQDLYYNTTFTKVLVYNNGTYTDHTDAMNTGGMVPLGGDINDAIYFGFNYKFDRIRCDIDTTGTDGYNQTEYYDGIGWDAMAGSGDLNFRSGNDAYKELAERSDMVKTYVNGSHLYWVRARVTTGYTVSPVLSSGDIGVPEWLSFGDTFARPPLAGADPIFYYHKNNVSTTVAIPPVCNPTDPTQHAFTLCHIPGEISLGVGNNSGRYYAIGAGFPAVVCPGEGFTDCGVGYAEKEMTVFYDTNRAYIWVPAACSGASGSTQTECEANGGTWIPGHYECDPSFTYDTEVAFTYGHWAPTAPTSIAYGLGDAQFLGTRLRHEGPAGGGFVDILCIAYSNLYVDIFDELFGDDLDELRHNAFTCDLLGATKIYTLYTKHVGIGLMTSGAVTLTNKDWVVNWGTADYFSGWFPNSGLSARNPGTSQVISDRPLTHHDGFYTGGIDIYGGWLYEPASSNGFLQRAVTTEVQLRTPVNHNCGFNWLYEPQLSGGHLSRTIDTDDKLEYPVNHNCGFNWLYEPITTPGFVSRDIDTETKIHISLCNNAGFNWSYKTEEPWVNKHRFVKNGGNDALDGKTFATAWGQWSYAMANIAEDGRLYAADGTYTEPGVDMSPQVGFQLFLITAAGEDDPCEIVITPA